MPSQLFWRNARRHCAGTRAQLAWPYFLGLVAAAGQFGWQLRTQRDRRPEHCLAAFRQNNLLGMTLWAGMALALALR